jgi:hypothetical protein
MPVHFESKLISLPALSPLAATAITPCMARSLLSTLQTRL